jgi:hypothetical protein
VAKTPWTTLFLAQASTNGIPIPPPTRPGHRRSQPSMGRRVMLLLMVGRARDNGHGDPDGPASKSTVMADGPDTLYELPKASIIVLRGSLRSQ